MTAPTSGTASDAGTRTILVRRTIISLAVVLVLSVPYVLFALLSGQWAAASWTFLGDLTGLVGLLLGGEIVAYLGLGLLTALTPISIVATTVRT